MNKESFFKHYEVIEYGQGNQIKCSPKGGMMDLITLDHI